MAEGQAGFCFLRRNEGGRLITLGYGHPAALQVDPIEKKPLNHFLPGTRILSAGSAGCNMGCRFCQNWSLSKAKSDHVRSVDLAPEDLVAMARRYRCESLAYTYNEPTIWAEYSIDISRRAREAGLRSVMVTNGYITEEALPEVYEFIDAANIDLKAFTENFYRKITLSALAPVLRVIERLHREGRVWIELTTLLIPERNDSPEEIRALCAWMLDHVGRDVPIHFTAFHPDYKLTDAPPTPPESLRRARDLAREAGLWYVYMGNVWDREGGTTCCPGCGATLIERDWHAVVSRRMRGNRCAACGTVIPGVFA